MNWHGPVPTGLNTEEEAEKCRTERRKMLPIITRVSHVKLEKNFQFSKCELRKAKLQLETSTGNAPPFCNRRESNTSGFESAATKKMCEIRPQPPKY